MDQLDLLPGGAAAFGETVKTAFDYYSLSKGVYKSLNEISQRPGAATSDWAWASIGLNLYRQFGAGEFLPAAFGGLATAGDALKEVGEAARSIILQDRAERLFTLGGAIPRSQGDFQRQAGAYSGSFSLIGKGYFVQGGWSLTNSSTGLFDRNSVYSASADSRVNGLATANGSVISGTFHRGEKRQESGESIFNLYDPTSVAITRTSSDRYNETFDGAGWDAAYRAQFPAATSPAAGSDGLPPEPTNRSTTSSRIDTPPSGPGDGGDIKSTLPSPGSGGRGGDGRSTPPPPRSSDRGGDGRGTPPPPGHGGGGFGGTPPPAGGSGGGPKPTPSPSAGGIVDGVSMKMKPSLTKKPTGSADEMAKDALGGRTPGSLGWTIEKKDLPK